jgi:RNA polymerase sigma-70 factor (ECF subfamily)
MKSASQDDRTSGFLALILDSQQDLRNYLFSLHPHAQDLDELFQETSIKLWETFGDYDSQRPFLPWALRIAYFQVLRFRKTRSRDRLVFSSDMIELLAGEAPVARQSDVVSSCLNDCLEKLTPRAREVLLARYSHNTNITEVAAKSRQSVHALYRILNSARSQVTTCLQKQLAAEGIMAANARAFD